jgi:hypothetical protein
VAVDRGEGFGIVSLDFAKAFDKVHCRKSRLIFQDIPGSVDDL